MDKQTKVYILIISIIMVILITILIVSNTANVSLDDTENLNSNSTETIDTTNNYIEPVSFKSENVISKITDVSQMNLKYTKYNEILSSNKYYFYAKGYINDTNGNEKVANYIMARENDSYALICKDLDFGSIIKNNKLHFISYSDETITTQTPSTENITELKEAYILDELTDLKTIFLEGGTVNIDGTTYSYEKYKIANEISEVYYFLEDELKYIKTIDTEADYSSDRITQVYDVSTTIKDNVLNLPSSYKQITK